MRRLVASVCVIAALVAPARALADLDPAERVALEPESPKSRPGFGKRGSFVFSVENLLGISSDRLDGRSYDVRGFFPGLFGARLGLHGVTDSGLTIGTGLGLSVLKPRVEGDSGESDGLLLLSALPRIGLARPFDGRLGYWIRTGPSLRFVKEIGDDDDTFLFGLGFDAFLVVTPVRHLGILFGPSVDFGLFGRDGSSNDETKFTSVQATIGLLTDH